MTEQNPVVRLRPWAIARAALAESFGSPISCFKQHWPVIPLLFVNEAISQWVIGDSLHYEGWQWRVDSRWILNVVVDTYIGTLLSIYVYRRLALGEPISGATLLPPWRRFAWVFLYILALRAAMMVLPPLFGIAVWPLAVTFEHRPVIGIVLGLVWLFLLNFAFCRFGPAFIMIVLDQGNAVFARSWAMTRGHVWRITLAFMWGYVPFIGCLLMVVLATFTLDNPHGLGATSLMVCGFTLIGALACPALFLIGLAIFRELAPSDSD